jgi:hypothetical protein
VTDDDSPFAHIPPPGIYERPSAITPAAEIAAYGAIAEGVKGRPTGVRVAVGLIVLLFLFGGGVFALVGLLFLSDGSDSEPPTPTPPSSSIQTVPLLPPAPAPAPPP